MKSYFDKLLGRLRDRDAAGVSSTPGANSELKTYIEELISKSTINWSQVIGSPTTNTELKSYIDNLLELVSLNQYTANQEITQQMIDYFTALQSQITTITNQITNLETVNSTFKTYVDTQVSNLATYINQLVLGDTYTSQLKQYIEDSVSNLQTILESLISTTVSNEVQNYIEQVTNVNTEGTRLISGTVTWIQNLVFFVSHLIYQILANRVESAEKTLTIPANTENNPRFAVIYADIWGNVGYILGTAAESPAVPLVNPSTQILITQVYIPANGTAPAPDPNGETPDIATETIYNENVEWTTAKTEETGVAINLEDTTEPAAGTKHISLAISGGTDTAVRSSLLSSDISQVTRPVTLTEPLVRTTGIITVPVTELFADHKTDSISGAIRHLVYYNLKQNTRLSAYLRRGETGTIYRLATLTPTQEAFSVSELNFSVDTLPASVKFTPERGFTPVPAGNYTLVITGFTRYDQQFIVSAATSFEPTAAALSFTRSAAIDATGGNISISLKMLDSWEANTALLFELYNGAAKIGSLVLMPENNYGFFPDYITDYQRITLPIADFSPTGKMIDKLVIRPVNQWPNSSLYVDLIQLQTGLQVTENPDKYVESVELDENAKMTIKQTGGQDDINVQFAKVAKTGSYDDLGNKPTLGSIASKGFWTGTASAYTALGTYDANTIYFIQE